LEIHKRKITEERSELFLTRTLLQVENWVSLWSVRLFRLEELRCELRF